MKSNIRVIPIAWSSGEEYHETLLDIAELRDGDWQGLAWYKILQVPVTCTRRTLAYW